MRLQGRITDWNDERGFGFVVTNGTENRHFFHISALRGSTERPTVGRLVTFEAQPQADGKLRAIDVRYPGTPARRPTAGGRPLGWAPDAAIGVAQAGLPAWLVLGERASPLLLAAIAAMSAIAVLMYYVDKRRAAAGDWRIPEAKLQLVGLLGGWLGALCAQRLFRHKSSKAAYVHVFRLAGIASIVALGAFAYGDLPQLGKLRPLLHGY